MSAMLDGAAGVASGTARFAGKYAWKGFGHLFGWVANRLKSRSRKFWLRSAMVLITVGGFYNPTGYSVWHWRGPWRQSWATTSQGFQMMWEQNALFVGGFATATFFVLLALFFLSRTINTVGQWRELNAREYDENTPAGREEAQADAAEMVNLRHRAFRQLLKALFMGGIGAVVATALVPVWKDNWVLHMSQFTYLFVLLVVVVALTCLFGYVTFHVWRAYGKAGRIGAVIFTVAVLALLLSLGEFMWNFAAVRGFLQLSVLLYYWGGVWKADIDATALSVRTTNVSGVAKPHPLDPDGEESHAHAHHDGAGHHDDAVEHHR